LDICKVILAIASPPNNAAYLTFSISERQLAVKSVTIHIRIFTTRISIAAKKPIVGREDMVKVFAASTLLMAPITRQPIDRSQRQPL
jgi:hypothetical protein